MNIVYGFGGMRSDDEILAFSPTIPICWNGYRFRVETDNGTIIVNVKTDRVEMTLESDRECEVLVYGEKYILSSKGQRLQYQKNGDEISEKLDHQRGMV